VRIEHYLDDFIFILPTIPYVVLVAYRTYNNVTNILSVLRNEGKNIEGTTAKILGIKINTIKIEARFSKKKKA